jgi:hypothetical protein
MHSALDYRKFKVICIMFKNSGAAPQTTHGISITDGLIVCREIIGVYYENKRKHLNTLYEQHMDTFVYYHLPGMK